MQIHGKDADPFFLEDLESARTLAETTERAELFLYHGEEHLFADSRCRHTTPPRRCSSTQRVLSFLDNVG